MTGELTPELRDLINAEIAADGGGGGGSQPAVYEAINGLVKNYDPPGGIDNCSALLLDPTAQPWQANHEYSNGGGGSPTGSVGATVTPTTNPNGVKFIAFENGGAVSGTVEPTWSQDGATPVDDGTPDRPLLWAPAGLYQLWAAGAALTGAVVGNGHLWSSDGGGLSGGTEPVWPATPAPQETISDGAITWTNTGPVTVWAPSHRYTFVSDTPPTTNYVQFNVIPIGAVQDTDYAFTGQPTGVYGTTGLTEPADWETATPGDSSVWMDNDIMWFETTASESLVLTGIQAPAGPALITIVNGYEPTGDAAITLEDKADVFNDYGADGESASGNEINGWGTKTLTPVAFAPLAYIGGEWRPKSALPS